MKKLEKFVIVLIVLWILQCVCSGFMPSLIAQIAAARNLDASAKLQILLTSISLLSFSVVSIACATWLFLEAKREEYSKWLWCLAGLVLKIDAVILFFVWLAFQEIQQMRIKNDVNPDRNIGSDTVTVK